MIKRFISVVFLVVFAFSCTSCGSTDKQSYSKSYYQYFDTVTTIKIYENDEKIFNSICNSLEKEVLKKYYQLFDIYNTYKGINNIKTINDNAGVKKVKVDRELIDFLNCCKSVYSITNGNVNVCLGPVLSVWHKFRDEGKKVPTLELLKSKNKLSEIDNLIIDKNNVFLKQKGSSIDVGAIAKGYVADKIYSFLVSKNVKNAIVDFGGNIITVGKKPNGESFSVGVANPDETDKTLITLKCKDGVIVSTSGGYERFYEVNGKKYSHIISPKTLLPAENNKSVTVICKSGYLADTLSTALYILDYKSGLNLINKTKNCEACIIDNSSNIHYSNGFNKYK